MQPCHVPNVNSIGPSSSSTFLQAVLGYGRLIPALLDDTVSKNVKSAPGSELRCTSRRSLWDGNVWISRREKGDFEIVRVGVCVWVLAGRRLARWTMAVLIKDPATPVALDFIALRLAAAPPPLGGIAVSSLSGALTLVKSDSESGLSGEQNSPMCERKGITLTFCFTPPGSANA